MLPAFLGKVHPKHKTPVNAIFLIGIATFFAPLLGRKALLWFVNAGSLGIVIAYFMVCISFLVLRRREPNMPRPFKVANGTMVGIIASVCSAGLIYMYMPFSPSALNTSEWLIFGTWMLLGLVFYISARKQFGTKETKKIISKDWK
jgi:amino acid transporter